MDGPNTDDYLQKIEQRKIVEQVETVIVSDNQSKSKLQGWAENGEAGDAKHFVHLFRNVFCFDHAAGLWHKFEGHYWVECELDEPMAACEALVEAYHIGAQKAFFRRLAAAKAGNEQDEKQAAYVEDLMTRKIKLLNRRSHRVNLLALAAAGAGSLGVTGREWDTQPYYLPCANGVLELQDYNFRPGQPGDYLKKYCPTPWEGPGAPRGKWEAFILEIMGGDAEKVDYLQRLLGSALAGQVLEHVLPVFWGAQRNGKGTFVETLSFVLGPLAVPVQAETLMAQKYPRSAAAPTPDIMIFRGARLCWASETDEGRRLNSGRVKWLTGGDTLTGRGPYDRRMITFRPSHQLILMTNFRPQGNPQDLALWARIHSVCFPLSFVDNPTKENERQRNPAMGEELKAEGPGILAWLVAGFYQWRENGLAPPLSILQETEAYRRSDDSVAHFISECCQIEEGFVSRLPDLFEKYQAFCEDTGFKPYGKRKLAKVLENEFSKERDNISIYYKGIALKDQFSSSV